MSRILQEDVNEPLREDVNEPQISTGFPRDYEGLKHVCSIRDM